MKFEKKPDLVPVASRLDKDLVKKVKSKMKKETAGGYEITWRKIWENGMRSYLSEKTRG